MSFFLTSGIGFLATSVPERYPEIGGCSEMKYLKQCRNRGNGIIITDEKTHTPGFAKLNGIG
jgi:hypothetical protein